MRTLRGVIIAASTVIIFSLSYFSGHKERNIEPDDKQINSASFSESLLKGKKAKKSQPPYIIRSGIFLQDRNLSDEEIRILREKQSFKSDGGYIYTPGRKVPKRRE